jgi:hypothetical protein
MTWEVFFSDASKKFLKKLRDATLLDRLIAATEKLSTDPCPRAPLDPAGDAYPIF